MAFVEVIGSEDATGELKAIYNGLEKTRGKLANIHTILSLDPKGLVAHMDLYMALMFGKSPLKRYQREMIGVVVSAANNCAYCQQHHGVALDHYWKNIAKVDRLAQNHNSVDLSEADHAICKLAIDLTAKPKSIDEDEHIAPMKKAGLDDRAIVDAVHIIAYFNYVNRLVLGLGVETEADNGAGYTNDVEEVG